MKRIQIVPQQGFNLYGAMVQKEVEQSKRIWAPIIGVNPRSAIVPNGHMSNTRVGSNYSAARADSLTRRFVRVQPTDGIGNYSMLF